MESKNQIGSWIKSAIGFALFLVFSVLLIQYSVPLFLVVLGFLFLLASMVGSLFVLQVRQDDVAGEKRTTVLATTRRILFDHFDESELRTLCLDLGINYDGLPGSGTQAKSRELVAYCARQGLLAQLVDRCLALRPHADWWDEPEKIRQSLAAADKKKDSSPPLKYPQLVPLAIAGLVLPPILGLAILSFVPTRTYVATALLGTATPSITILPTVTLTSTSLPSSIPSPAPTDTAVPTLTPPPLAVATATPDEVLVLIAEFDGAADYDPVRRIHDQLRHDLQGDPSINGRVERVPDIVGTQEEAQQLGQLYDATLVIWGSYDTLGISPHYEVIRGQQKLAAQVALEQTVNLPSEPDRFVLYITRDMGDQLSYLSLFTLGQMAAYDGDYERAMIHFYHALAIRPQGLDHDLGEASLYFYRGYIQQVINENPGTASQEYSNAILFNDQDPLLFYNRGLAYHQQEQYTAALADYDRAIALDDSMAAAYYNRGNIYRVQGEYDAAIDNFNQTLVLKPNDTPTLYGRGFVYLQQEDYLSAIQDFNEVILHDRQHVEAYLGRGLAYLGTGAQETAVANFTFILEQLAPNNVNQQTRTYLLRAGAYIQMMRYEEAEADLRAILTIDPENALAHNELAWLLANDLETNLDEAVLLAQQAVLLAQSQDADNSTIAFYLDTLGWAYYKQGALTLARDTLERGLEICNQCSEESALLEHLSAVEANVP